MKLNLKNHYLGLSVAALGLLGGFLYWRFVGCKSGSCPITSTWHMSTLMGGIMGYLIGDSVDDIRKKRKQKVEGGE